MAIQLMLFDLGFGLEEVVGREDFWSDDFAAWVGSVWSESPACDW